MSWYQMLLEKLKIVRYLKSLQAMREERGAIFVLTALLLPMMLGFLGFAYDVGNLYMYKARLQNTADAAALAGARAYVNALGEDAVNGVATNATDAEKSNAVGQLKSEAEKYIRGNNPLFAGKSGKKEEFAIGTRTISKTSTKEKTSEYFRVILREPVGLYFLPVIGVRKNVEVSVYATTKLSDTEKTAGTDPIDAQNKPVVITGSILHDEINTNDIIHNTYNDYNISTVYVTEGSDITGAVKIDGKYVVPSSQGEIEGRVWKDNNNYVTAHYAEIVPTEYDMYAFGVEIKKRFVEKYIQTLPEGERAAATTRMAEFITALKAWNNNESLKKQWEVLEKRVQQEHDRKYDEEYYKIYNESAHEAFQKAVLIYQLIINYRNQLEAKLSEYNGGRQSVYEQSGLKQQFKNEMMSLTNNTWNDNFHHYIEWENLDLKEPDFGIWIKGGNGQPGQWNQYAPFGFTSPTVLTNDQINTHMSEYETQVLTPYMAEYRARVTPSKSASNLGAEPKPEDFQLEYYMTFKGDRNKVENLYTYDISTNPSEYGLNANEHSYLFLSKSKYTASAAEDLTIHVNGFYTGGQITTDTPYYLLVDSDLKVTNVIMENCNRPLVLCYLGKSPIHYEFYDKDVKGIFYSPHSKGDTHVNGDGITFSGSIISDELTLKSHRSSFEYNPKEVKKWQDASEGLPATPNIGFVSSGGETVEGKEEITILDRLRLYLAGGSNANNYYKNADIVWTDI